MLPLWYLSFIILGSIVGSFLNAWIWRTRMGMSIVCGRSMCPHCHHELGFFDLIPIISFFIRKKTCHYCHQKISWQYPFVEVSVAALFLFVAWVHADTAFQLSFFMIKDLVVVTLLTVIFVYDFLYLEIWDRTTTIPALILFPLSIFFGWVSWQSMLIGIGIGAGFFLLQYVVSKGKWVGGGDIRLGIFMGVVLGYPRVILALLFAYIIGAGISLLLIACKKKRLASETPFGTYLALGTCIALFWGDRIIDWYISLIGF